MSAAQFVENAKHVKLRKASAGPYIEWDVLWAMVDAARNRP